MVHSERRRGKSRTRILYWFRTPPGVRVGRAALDEDAIRQIEELNPFIEFDWTRILKGQGGPPTEARPPEEARRPRQRERDQAPRQERRDQPPRAQQPSRPPAAVTDTQTPWDEMRAADADAEATPSAFDGGVTEFSDFRAALEDGSEGGLEGGLDDRAERVSDTSSDMGEPAALAASTADVSLPIDAPILDALIPPTPAGARLGAEGLQRLRARHAEILTRISEKVPDPVRRDELKSLADRLNPDMWVTDAEVTLGLEQYESVFASLREVVGRKRRRRRRGNRSARPAATSDARASAETAEPDDDVRTGGGVDDELVDETDSGEDPGSGEV